MDQHRKLPAGAVDIFLWGPIAGSCFFRRTTLSAGELTVTLGAVYKPDPAADIATGNFVGSNISSILLVMGNDLILEVKRCQPGETTQLTLLRRRAANGTIGQER